MSLTHITISSLMTGTWVMATATPEVPVFEISNLLGYCVAIGSLAHLVNWLNTESTNDKDRSKPDVINAFLRALIIGGFCGLFGYVIMLAAMPDAKAAFYLLSSGGAGLSAKSFIPMLSSIGTALHNKILPTKKDDEEKK